MKTVGAVVVAVLLGMTFASAPANGNPAGTEHLPDLRTLKPSEIRVTQTCGFLFFNCKKKLQFSNIVGNYGGGFLELRPQHNTTTGKTTAYQRTYSHNASGQWNLVREFPVGTFAFHPEHNHTHFEGFANYSLVTASAADNAITGIQKRSSQKTTFCIIDTTWLGSTLEHAGAQTYTRCGQSDWTGLTPGWADRYGWNLAGQEMDVTGVGDGYFWLVSTADFQGRLLESDETNNCSAAKIEIRGTTVYDRGQRIPC